jgi:hypothetical protein
MLLKKEQTPYLYTGSLYIYSNIFFYLFFRYIFLFSVVSVSFFGEKVCFFVLIVVNY